MRTSRLAALAALTACSLSACSSNSTPQAQGAATQTAASATTSAPAAPSLTDLMGQKGYESGALFMGMSDDEINAVTADDKQICTMMSDSQQDTQDDGRAYDKKVSLLLARLATQASDPSIKTVLGSLSSAMVAKQKDQMSMAFALMGEWPAMQSVCRTLGIKVASLSMS